MPAEWGVANLRDVGGMPRTDGGTIASGVLLRSAALDRLTPDGLAALAAGPVGTIVDFRTDAERHAAPDRLPTERPFHVVDLPLTPGAATGLRPSSIREVDPEVVRAALAALPSLGGLYIGLLGDDDGEDAFAEVARLVAEASGPHPAVLLHCTAGKDRTGVATALLLEVAGASREAIIDDYARSESELAGPWADGITARVEAMGVPIDDRLRALLTQTPPEAMREALAWVDDEFGGAHRYLRAAGASSATLDRVAERLRAA